MNTNTCQCGTTTENKRLQSQVAQLKNQQNNTVSFLKTLSKEIGMIWGPEIEKHLSTLTGSAITNWNVADTNGEQGR